VPDELIDAKDTVSEHIEDVSFARSVEDSLLQQIEQEEKNNLSIIDAGDRSDNLSKLNFFTPVSKGLIINRFDKKGGHFGLDILAAPDAGISAVLDGTVIVATWTLATGHVIQVQHSNNLISLYKHNSVLLKSVGSHVKAGEPIAIIGNSGELTTGPHLHFELWHNGTALNPENYIVF